MSRFLSTGFVALFASLFIGSVLAWVGLAMGVEDSILSPLVRFVFSVK